MPQEPSKNIWYKEYEYLNIMFFILKKYRNYMSRSNKPINPLSGEVIPLKDLSNEDILFNQYIAYGVKQGHITMKNAVYQLTETGVEYFESNKKKYYFIRGVKSIPKFFKGAVELAVTVLKP